MVIASNSILGVAALNSNSLFLLLHLSVKTRVLLAASALSRWFFSVVIASNSTLTELQCRVILAPQCQVGWFPGVTTTCLFFSPSCTSVSRELDPWVATTIEILANTGNASSGIILK